MFVSGAERLRKPLDGEKGAFMAKCRCSVMKLALVSVVLLCFGFIALAPAAPAAASEQTSLASATITTQGDTELTTQSGVVLHLSKTVVYVGQRPSVKGVTYDGSNVTGYFSFSGKIPSGAGMGSITATGKQGTTFAGVTVTKKFKVRPRGVSLYSPTPLVGGFKATWGMNTNGTTGYQLQYATNNSFSSAKTITINDNRITAKSKTGLKEGTGYYVRVRAISSTSDGVMKSPWSGAAYVVTKKKSVPKYQPTQKLKITYMNREGSTCIIGYTRASQWYQYTGAASGKVSGYEVQYADNRSFNNYTMRTTFDQANVYYRATALTKSKTYYFRVRLFNTVKAKSYYGPWSAVRSTNTSSGAAG